DLPAVRGADPGRPRRGPGPAHAAGRGARRPPRRDGGEGARCPPARAAARGRGRGRPRGTHPPPLRPSQGRPRPRPRERPRGAARDLPALLAEGLVERLGVMAERVPGARQHVLLREDAVAAVHEGRIPTPSGRRRYDPVPAPEVGMLWRILMVALEDYGLGPESVTVGVGADLRLLRAAREAGIRRMAIAPRRLPPLSTDAGRALWEGIAEACDDGAVLELVVDPRPGGNLGPELEMMLETWRRLGHSDADAAGVAVIAHTGASHDLHSG